MEQLDRLCEWIGDHGILINTIITAVLMTVAFSVWM
jgi:hypothetical protein